MFHVVLLYYIFTLVLTNLIFCRLKDLVIRKCDCQRNIKYNIVYLQCLWWLLTPVSLSGGTKHITSVCQAVRCTWHRVSLLMIRARRWRGALWFMLPELCCLLSPDSSSSPIWLTSTCSSSHSELWVNVYPSFNLWCRSKPWLHICGNKSQRW